jgi:putative peptidoglycan lipid II flippase
VQAIQSMSESSRVAKAAGVVGAATLLSRLLGFIRDAVIAWYLGAGYNSDAFIAAFRIPDLMRKLLAEGSLSSAFVPVFTECLVHRGRSEAFHLARATLRALSVFLLGATIAGMLLSPWLVRIIAPGFTDDKLSLTITLTRIMFPYIFFVGLVALFSGILNALGHFVAPALAPVLLNLAIIGSVFLIAPSMSKPVSGLACGVMMGGVLQLVLQLPFLVQKGFRFWENAKMIHPGLSQIVPLVPPVILGSSVYQINIVVSTLLGSLLPEGSVTYLYYADRLVQFPLGIFTIAAATAILPSLSRQAAVKDFEALKTTLSQAVKLVFFITLPAMVGLIVLREPIVALLFQRGEFDAQASRLTSQALLYYCLGLWAFSAVRMVVATFFALQDTRTPVYMAVIAIIFNVVLGVVLMKPLAHGGLALATSLASILNLGLLVAALSARLGSLGWKSMTVSIGRTMIGSGVMGLAVWTAALVMVPGEGRTLSGLIWGLLGSMATGLCIYGAFSYFVRSPEFGSVLAQAKKGMRKK